MFKNALIDLVEVFYDERQRWFLWLPVLFAIGIGSYFSLSFEPSIWVGIILVETFILTSFLLRYRPIFLILSICFLVISIGFSYMQMRSYYVKAPFLTKKINYAKVEGRIIKIEKFPSSFRLTFDNLNIAKLKNKKTPKKIRIKFNFPDIKIKNGEYVKFFARLMPPSQSLIPKGYNFARKAFFEQIGAVGFSFSRPETIKKNIETSLIDSFLFKIDLLRKNIAKNIYKVLPEDNGKICASLIAGQRGEVDRKITNNYRDSGLAHMLSISGLHMGLFASLVFFIFRFLFVSIPFVNKRINAKKIASVFAIIAVSFYLLISGMRVPSQRAYFMTVVVLLGVLFDRKAISMRLIMWAGFVVLLFHPEALISPSFQMSFAAVIALVGAYEAGASHFSNYFYKKNSKDEFWFESFFRVLSAYILGILVSDFIASLATTPYAIYHFNRVAVYTLLGNFLAAPFFGLIVMPCAVLSLILMSLGFEYYPLTLMGFGVDIMNEITEYVSSLPASVLLVPKIPTFGICLISLGGIWLCIWQKKWRLVGVFPIIIGFLSVFMVKTPDIIIDKDAKVLAIKHDDNLYFMPSRSGSFVKRTWLEHYGLEKVEKQVQENFWKNNVKCDDLGCVFEIKENLVSFSKRSQSLQKDCKKADILISKSPVKITCENPKIIIDRFDLYYKKTHLIYIKNDYISAYNLRNMQGKRFWSN